MTTLASGGAGPLSGTCPTSGAFYAHWHDRTQSVVPPRPMHFRQSVPPQRISPLVAGASLPGSGPFGPPPAGARVVSLRSTPRAPAAPLSTNRRNYVQESLRCRSLRPCANCRSFGSLQLAVTAGQVHPHPAPNTGNASPGVSRAGGLAALAGGKR